MIRDREAGGRLRCWHTKANKDQDTPHQMAEVRDYQRRGQFRTDFIIAENSMAFHGPQEAVPILGDAIKLWRSGEIRLRGGPAASHRSPDVAGNRPSAPRGAQ